MDPREEEISRYRGLIMATRERLTAQSDAWESKLTAQKLTDEISGEIRTVIGQARLVINSKGRLTQFQNLVDNCQFKLGEKETKTSDLGGFWDMINFQLQDVDNKFLELTELEKNDWKRVEKEEPKLLTMSVEKVRVRKKISDMKKNASTSKKLKRPASTHLRDLIAAKRNEIKITKSGSVSSNESATSPPPNLTLSSTKNFQGGFFHITSPIRLESPPVQRFLSEKKGLRRQVLTEKSLNPAEAGSEGPVPIKRIKSMSSSSPLAIIKVSRASKKASLENAKQSLFLCDKE